MKLLVEPFTSLTGWSSSGTIAAYNLNTFPEYIADNLASSLIVHVPSGNLGKTFTKTISPALDVSKYSEVVFHVWSRGKRGYNFRFPADFAYKISFDGVKQFYVPTYAAFGDVTISLAGVPTINQVTITALTNDEDYLVLSALNAILDEYPLDILTAFQNELAAKSILGYPDGFAIADTLSGLAGDTRVTLTDPAGLHNFVSRYALLKIKDPPNTEYHIIEEFDESAITFKQSWDGAALKFPHTNAPLFIAYPVTITLGETDLIAPSIALQAMEPEPILRTSGNARLTDTFMVGASIAERQEEQRLRYSVLIDCEAPFYEHLARLNRIVRQFMAQNAIWINARKHDFLFDIPGQQVDPTSVNETLPKTQWTVDIEVKESVGQRAALPLYTTPRDTWTIVAQGGKMPV